VAFLPEPRNNLGLTPPNRHDAPRQRRIRRRPRHQPVETNYVAYVVIAWCQAAYF